MPGISRSREKPKPNAAREFVLPDYLTDDMFQLRESADNDMNIVALRASYRAEHKGFRLRCALLGVAVAVVALLSLCVSYDGAGLGKVYFYPLSDAVHALYVWATVNLSNAFSLGWYPAGTSVYSLEPLYLQVVPRLGMTVATLVCGAMLACAGMLYQTVFRNPIASPSLLGITDGVKVGLLMLFMSYGTMASGQVAQRFAYGYAAGIATLVVVFVLSKLITKRHCSISVFDVLVVGTIVSAFLSALSKYILDMLATVDMWQVFFEFQEGLDIYNDPVTYAVLAVSVLVSFVPVVLIRFHLSLVAMPAGEARTMGGNPAFLRVFTLIAGSLMILTAQVFVGPASSFALVIPFLSRLLFGAEFRKQLWGNVLLGVLVLLVCRELTILIPFAGIGIPIGTLASVITLPVFVWATVLTKRAWQQ